MPALIKPQEAVRNVSRRAILQAAESRRVHAFMTRYGMRLGARRFVPAESLDEVVVAFRELNGRGIRGVTGLFDDTAHDHEAVERHEAEYRRQIDRLASERLDANVGLKLTHLGAHVDAETTYAATYRLAEHAGSVGMRLRIDMEESELVDLTLATYRRLRAAGIDNIGVVLQSYLRRTERDLDELLPLGLNVRLVKGAYLEPSAVAYQDKAEVDSAYVRMLERTLADAEFTAIATHDTAIIDRAKLLIAASSLSQDRFEFQMLYGIASRLQVAVVAEGYPLRVAAPYGPTWFPYLMRRLAERPANVAFFLRNIFK
jgi:proline dehydrogenase